MSNKFSFLKCLFGITVVVILLMLWWSTTLIEEDVKRLNSQVQALSKQLQDLPGKVQRTHIVMAPKEAMHEQPSHIDTTLPNLLEQDPFYNYTLPQMLGAEFQAHGTRREAMVGKPQNLHPFNGFAHVSSMVNMCTVSVARLQFGKYETMAPDMAIKLEKRPVPDHPEEFEYWVHLRDHVYWQPLNPAHFPNNLELSEHFLKKHKVTAEDFKFCYDAIMNPHVSETKAAAMRTYFGDIKEFRVIDEQTFVVRWEQSAIENEEGKMVMKPKYSAQSLTGALHPLPRFVFQYFADGQKIVPEEEEEPDTYRTHSIWAQNFIEHWAKNVIVSCGSWLFSGMDEEKITFTRNPDFYDPYQVLVEQLTYTFKESPENIWQDFKVGKIDTCQLTPAQLLELQHFLTSSEYAKQQSTIKEIDYVDQAYYYIGWNEKRIFFQDAKIRQALTMAINRDQIIQQNLNDMGIAITGPFARFSPAYDATLDAWPYNPDRARQLLDQAGWVDMNGDGIRDQLINGKLVPFRFTLIYYVKSHASKAIAESIKEQLKEVGIECKLSGLDLPDLSRKFDDKNFDAIYLGWKLGTPPEDPKQLWHSSGATIKGSSNAISFQDQRADDIIHKLSYEDDPDKRIELYHTFHKIIHEKAPYTFLYSPKAKLVYRDYIKNLFIPMDRQDLVPGANVSEPDMRIIYIE
jgi:peptide/nickel transport system substrate-binding protein